MRSGFILAGALILMTATGAQAEEWCGYAIHHDAVVECGYTNVADCQTAVGKGGMCFVDPELALNARHAAPLLPAKFSPPPLTAAGRRS